MPTTHNWHEIYPNTMYQIHLFHLVGSVPRDIKMDVLLTPKWLSLAINITEYGRDKGVYTAP